MNVVPRDELSELCRRALLSAGASEEAARVLAEATVQAELLGNRAVGVRHLFDYLTALAEGRIDPGATPLVRQPAPATLTVDADGGLAQTAFAAARPPLLDAIAANGVAALWIRGSFTCGELGYYPRLLAAEGMISLAAANSNALMSIGGAPTRVLGTNPLAYAVPRPGMLPLVIDQAASSTAFVNVRRAAQEGASIPDGWALDPDGRPTQDAAAAVAGALLPFGGHRGGNVALLVELLATLAGASFSLDAAPFDSGQRSPGIGVFVLGIDPQRFPGSLERLAAWFDALQHKGVRLPSLEVTQLPEAAELDDKLLATLRLAAR